MPKVTGATWSAPVTPIGAPSTFRTRWRNRSSTTWFSSWLASTGTASSSTSLPKLTARGHRRRAGEGEDVSAGHHVPSGHPRSRDRRRCLCDAGRGRLRYVRRAHVFDRALRARRGLSLVRRAGAGDPAGGRVVDVPLYMFSEPAVQTDPTYSIAVEMAFDPGAVVYCAEGWGQSPRPFLLAGNARRTAAEKSCLRLPRAPFDGDRVDRKRSLHALRARSRTPPVSSKRARRRIRRASLEGALPLKGGRSRRGLPKRRRAARPARTRSIADRDQNRYALRRSREDSHALPGRRRRCARRFA